MHNRPWYLTGCAVFLGASLWHGPTDAHARPLYNKVYKEVYPTKEATSKCAICHVGQDKKNRTDYGKSLEEALGAKNVKDVEAIKAALNKVGPAP